MRILKRILQAIGALVGTVVLYLAVIALAPVLSIEKQPLSKTGPSSPQVELQHSSLRKEVRFQSGGASISAWLFMPDNRAKPAPCVVMAHGFGGVKDMGLEAYAIRFRDAGYAVLVFDYRFMGASEGEPRQLLWIPYQLEDWAAAVAYARSMKDIDPAKIALWGTSLSGGHVIVIASQDHAIACVSAQCPAVDGYASGELIESRSGVSHMIRMIMHGQRDMVRSWLGLSPHTIPIVGKPGSPAALNTPDAYTFFTEHASPGFVNEVCARILLRGMWYRPIESARNVRCPVLLLMCEKDALIPKSAVEATAKELGKYGDLKRYPIGHFDIYTGKHAERAVGDQLAFFNKYL